MTKATTLLRKAISMAILASCTFSFAQKSDPKKEILKVLKKQESDWNKGSVKDYMDGYWKNDSLVFIGKKGPSYGWQATYDGYVKRYPPEKMGKLDFSQFKINMIGHNHAQVIGHWHLTRPGDEPQGFFTLIFKKFNDGWKIISDHTE